MPTNTTMLIGIGIELYATNTDARHFHENRSSKPSNSRVKRKNREM